MSEAVGLDRAWREIRKRGRGGQGHNRAENRAARETAELAAYSGDLRRLVQGEGDAEIACVAHNIVRSGWAAPAQLRAPLTLIHRKSDRLVPVREQAAAQAVGVLDDPMAASVLPDEQAESVCGACRFDVLLDH